jgi:hypothetical protein
MTVPIFEHLSVKCVSVMVPLRRNRVNLYYFFVAHIILERERKSTTPISKRLFETSEAMRILNIRHIIHSSLFIRNLFRVRLPYLLLIRSTKHAFRIDKSFFLLKMPILFYNGFGVCVCFRLVIKYSLKRRKTTPYGLSLQKATGVPL